MFLQDTITFVFLGKIGEIVEARVLSIKLPSKCIGFNVKQCQKRINLLEQLRYLKIHQQIKSIVVGVHFYNHFHFSFNQTLHRKFIIKLTRTNMCISNEAKTSYKYESTISYDCVETVVFGLCNYYTVQTKPGRKVTLGCKLHWSPSL